MYEREREKEREREEIEEERRKKIKGNSRWSGHLFFDFSEYFALEISERNN